MINKSSGGLIKATKKVSKLDKLPKIIRKERLNSPLSIQILFFLLVIYFIALLLIKLPSFFNREITMVGILGNTKKVLTNQATEHHRTISSYDWKEDVKQKWGNKADIAFAIAYAESGWKKDATGYNCIYDKKVKACEIKDRHLAISTDSGIFQIAKIHGYNEKTLHNPKENVRIAYEIYEKQGFNAWYTYRNGKYKEFLK